MKTGIRKQHMNPSPAHRMSFAGVGWRGRHSVTHPVLASDHQAVHSKHLLQQKTGFQLSGKDQKLKNSTAC